MNRVWNQYNMDHSEAMKSVLEHSAVASNSAAGGTGTPLTPESGVEMTGFDPYPTNTKGREEGNDGDNESDIDLEISNIQDMIPDIVDLVYEGDGQETTNKNGGNVNNEEKLY